MIIAYDNKYNLSTLTASDANSAFPVTNSQDTRLSKLFKTTGTSVNIVIDLAESLTATGIFIANHNLTSSATITLEANATDVWTSPSYTNTIAYNADTIYELFATQTYRYWRLVISDATNPDGVLIFGGCFLGTYLTMLDTFSHVLTESTTDTTVISRSLSGQVYTDNGYIFDSWDLNFPRVTLSGKTSIQAYKATNRKKPVYVMLDESSTSEFIPSYVTIDDISYSRVFNNFYTISMKLREAK